MAVAGLIGDVCERPAHLVLDRVGRQKRLGVHRVEIIDPVEQRRIDLVRTKSARDRIKDDGAAEAPDMHRWVGPFRPRASVTWG